jgi:hypothetical protein
MVNEALSSTETPPGVTVPSGISFQRKGRYAMRPLGAD